MNKSELIRSYIKENNGKVKRSELCKRLVDEFGIRITTAREYVRVYEDALEEEKKELLVIKEVDIAMHNRELKLPAIKRLSAKYNISVSKLDYIWLDLRLKQYYGNR